MKFKVLYCEKWFTNDKGNTFYKTRFVLEDKTVCLVTTRKPYNTGDDIVLTIGRDSKTEKPYIRVVY